MTGAASPGQLSLSRLPSSESARSAATRAAAAAVPVIVVHEPTDEIVVASVAAVELMTPGGKLLGRSFTSVVPDHDRDVRTLFSRGRLTAFETRRTLTVGSHRIPASLSVRRFDRCPPDQFGVVAIRDLRRGLGRPETADSSSRAATQRGTSIDSNTVAIGAVAADLTVTHIGAAAASLARVAGLAVGRSLLTAFESRDHPQVRSAFADSARSRRVTCVAARLGAAGSAVAMATSPALLCVVSADPAPGWFFTLEEPDQSVLERAGQEAAVVPAAACVSALAEADRPKLAGWAQLTGREIEVVTRLLTGDRVPAIARTLFLSQSTVRSHLASASHKLGVSDQQGLIDLLRML